MLVTSKSLTNLCLSNSCLIFVLTFEIGMSNSYKSENSLAFLMYLRYMWSTLNRMSECVRERRVVSANSVARVILVFKDSRLLFHAAVIRKFLVGQTWGVRSRICEAAAKQVLASGPLNDLMVKNLIFRSFCSCYWLRGFRNLPDAFKDLAIWLEKFDETGEF